MSSASTAPSEAETDPSDCCGVPIVPVVVLGPTQSGKSTFISKVMLSEQPSPAVGNGDGESVTFEPKVFETVLSPMLDTPGTFDSKHRFTDSEAGQMVAMALAATGALEVKFLIVESLAGDSIRLKWSLNFLVQSFGESALGSALVLASKADRCASQKSSKQRLDKLTAISKERGLGGVVTWQSKTENEDEEDEVDEREIEMDEPIMKTQLHKLKSALDDLPSVKLSELEDLQTRIQAKAQELCDSQPPREKTIPVVVEEEYEVAVKEKYFEREPRIELVPYTEWYTGIEYGYELKNVWVTYEEPVFFFGLFGVTETKHRRRLESVWTPRNVKKSRTRYRTEVEYCKVKKVRTKYEARTRSVTKFATVPDPFPLSSYVAEARNLVLEEIRASLSTRGPVS